MNVIYKGKYKEEFEALKNDNGYREVLFRNIDKLESKDSEFIYNELIKFCDENEMINIRPWVEFNLGWINYDLGRLDNAIALHNKSLKEFQLQKNDDGILAAINALVAEYSFQEEFVKAVELGMIGVKLAENKKDYMRIYTLKNNIATTYMDLEEYEKAIALLKQILKLPNIISSENQVVAYLNLGECLNKVANYDKAIMYLEKALNIAKEYEMKIIPQLLDQLARVYTDKGEYEIADSIFKKSIEMTSKNQLGLFSQEAITYSAVLDVKRGKFEEAIKKLTVVEEKINEYSSKRNRNIIYVTLSQAYKEIGSFEQSLKYLEMAYEIEVNKNKNRKKEVFERLDEKNNQEEGKIYKLLYNQTEMIYSLGQKITSNLNKDEIFNIIADEISGLINYDIMQIAVIKGELLEYQLSIESGDRIYMGPTLLTDKSLAGYSVKHRKEILINDLSKEYCNYVDNYEEYIKVSTSDQEALVGDIPQSVIFVPIYFNEKVVGIISTQAYEKNSYSLRDVMTLDILATYMGIALENNRLYKKLEYNANYDRLTNVLNRGAILRKCEEVRNIIIDENDDYYIGMIDIDDFKLINDTYGHLVGDSVLEKVSDACKSIINEKGFVGRYGGEEFIIIYKDNNKSFLRFSEELRAMIENIKVDNNIKVTASIGITKLDREDILLNEIINRADIALYEAKNTGKNKVIIYS